MFLLPERSKQSSNNCSKTVQHRFPKASYNFSLFLPGPEPTKHKQSERFCGVGGRGAHRVAKARLATGYTRELPYGNATATGAWGP